MLIAIVDDIAEERILLRTIWYQKYNNKKYDCR